jgi:hypothetical protein
MATVVSPAACAEPARAAALPTAASQASDAADIAHYKMWEKRFQSPEVIDADRNLYVQQLATEAARSRADASAMEALTLQNRRVAASVVEDLDTRKRLFDAQGVYNLCIFLVVVVIVLAGLGFSYVQFTAERRRAKELGALIQYLKGLQPTDPRWTIILARFDDTAQKTMHSFEAGPLKITSNVVGLIVLAMSLAFFYLYVDRVYTIHPETHLPAHETTKTTTGQPDRPAAAEPAT